MFEINRSRKTQQSDNVKSGNNTVQQRAFLNEPKDTLELSTKKKKKSISFGSAIGGVLSAFNNNDEKNTPPVSPKAVKMLKSNNLVSADFEPERSIVPNNPETLTDMPVAFQRKLAIDIIKRKPDSQEEVDLDFGAKKARITYNNEGKPSEIEYINSENDEITHSESFEYAHKQDGTPVLIKQNTYKHTNGEKLLDEEISYHKHHNGVVTISSTDGRQMSYSLRKETIRNYENNTKGTQPQTTEHPEQSKERTVTKKQPEQTVVTSPQATEQELAETATIQPKLQTVQTQEPETNPQKANEPERKLFKAPNPVYPHHEYSKEQLEVIDKKFDKLKNSVFKEYPSEEDAYRQRDSVIEGLDKIKELVFDTKDPVLQKEILKSINKMKDNDVPTNYVGWYNRLDVNSEYSELTKIYNLAKISALIGKDTLSLDKDYKIVNNLNEKLPYTGGAGEAISPATIFSENNKIERILKDETLSENERQSEIQKVLFNLQLSELEFGISSLSHKFPEMKEHLKDTYITQNIPEELRNDLSSIEKAKGKMIIPLMYSNFSMDNLEAFHNLSDIAKEHYLRHPNMCRANYLADKNSFGIETPYNTLSSLTKDEWNTFEERNLADNLDIITGNNINTLDAKKGNGIKTAINMSNAEWQKMQDFGLFKLGIEGNELSFEKHKNVKFKFEQSQDIIKNMSYKDWETAQNRGLLDIKSNLCMNTTNYEKNISIPVLFAATNVPNSTFNFLKDKIDLFKNNKLEFPTEDSIDTLAAGISFLAKSHNDVYENVQKLCKNEIKPNFVIDMVGICAKEYNKFGKYETGKILELKNKGLSNSEIRNILPMYIDMQTVKGKSNINELSIEEKRGLLKNIIKYNATLFSGRYANLFNSDIIPKNKEEYCTIVPKLVKSIGIDTRPATQEIIDNFNDAISEMSKPDSEFLNTKITKDGFKPQLEYPRTEFINNVLEKTAGMNELEQNKVFDYFGFDIKQDNDGNLQMHGYPANINRGSKLAEIKNENTKKFIEEVRPLVDKFTTNNNVTIEGKPEITKQINDILELFPELRTTIDKKQHKTHDFTVDVHTLKVLQGIMADTRYNELSKKDQQLLCISALLHDLTKLENSVDKTHPMYSAYDSYYLLNKMDMSEVDKTKVYKLIKNHEWLERYNGKVKTGPHTYRDKTQKEKEIATKDIAFDLKDGNNFELASILTKADMKAVKETDEFFDRFSDAYNSGIEQIEPLIDNIKKTAIILPQTKLPKASNLKVDGKNIIEVIQKDKNGNEIKNKVIRLKPNMDLGKLGFEKGLNSDDLNVIVHAIDYDTQSATLQALGDINNDSLLSSSYVNYKKGNYHVFRQQGFVLDIDSENIQAGTYKDFNSGYGKDLNTLKQEYLFNGERKEIRNFMSDKLKNRMGLSDEDYKKLYPTIKNKSITELDEINPEVAKNLRELFLEMDVHRRKFGRDYNEWLISKPKIQGVFLQSRKYQDCVPPKYLAKYAEENNLPIIYFGE